jgi:ASC-1-like (ASCH) protein
MDIFTFSGDLDFITTRVKDRLDAHTSAGNVHVVSLFDSDLKESKVANITCDAGSITGTLQQYDSLFAETRAGNIHLQLEPLVFSGTKISSKVGDISLQLV